MTRFRDIRKDLRAKIRRTKMRKLLRQFPWLWALSPTWSWLYEEISPRVDVCTVSPAEFMPYFYDWWYDTTRQGITVWAKVSGRSRDSLVRIDHRELKSGLGVHRDPIAALNVEVNCPLERVDHLVFVSNKEINIYSPPRGYSDFVEFLTKNRRYFNQSRAA